MVTTAEKTNVGYITQIIGPGCGREVSQRRTCPKSTMPSKFQGKNPAGNEVSVTCEVQQLLGDSQVRAVAMSSTDGLVRGMEVVDTVLPSAYP
jgi:F-type H+-transporting ATPase subunit beta